MMAHLFAETWVEGRQEDHHKIWAANARKHEVA